MALEELRELVNALAAKKMRDPITARYRVGKPDDHFGNDGTMYCPSCCEYSGMKLETLYFGNTVGEDFVKELTREDTFIGSPRPKFRESPNPSLVQLDCVNCSNDFYGLIYKSEIGPTVVFFSGSGGGIATPKTPDVVKYYLEQAYKAQCATAYSASLAMYRAALEQLLEDKGFNGNLAAKIEKLTKDIENGVAPTWAKRLNTEALAIIKEICNRHVHPNELSKLQAIDAAFMAKVQGTFAALLNIAYEQESRQAAAKSKLEVALQKAKKKKASP
jgi:hypothetical protein